VTQFIALCGYPKVGKSEVQDVIRGLYGFTPVDDSQPLREAAKILYGLTDWHVSTQAGKASTIRVGTQDKTIRKVLGDLGCYFETEDEFHFPRLAVSSSLKNDRHGRFVFASVRRNQPRFFKNLGDSLVLEVTRNGCKAEGVFDEYDRDAVDLTISNDYDPDHPAASRQDLEARVKALLDPILIKRAA